MSESNRFPSVNEVAVKSGMPRFPQEKLYSAVDYTFFEDLDVSWIDFVIAGSEFQKLLLFPI